MYHLVASWSLTTTATRPRVWGCFSGSWDTTSVVEYDGPTGLAAAAEFVPDVALIDIGLPGLSGHDVARRIREDLRLRNVLLVAQTGWGQESDRQRSLEAGFDHHLVKPVDLATFQKLLGGREADSDSP